MQPATVATPLWLEIIRSPAVLIVAGAFGVKWVIAPAFLTYFRHELQAELKQLAQFPLFVDRVTRVEDAVAALSGMPEQLARIEEQVKALHTDRRKG